MDSCQSSAHHDYRNSAFLFTTSKINLTETESVYLKKHPAYRKYIQVTSVFMDLKAASWFNCIPSSFSPPRIRGQRIQEGMRATAIITETIQDTA